MKLNEKNFNNYFFTNFIFEKRPSVAVAVSGGPDSMLLSYLLNKCSKILMNVKTLKNILLKF